MAQYLLLHPPPSPSRPSISQRFSWLNLITTISIYCLSESIFTFLWKGKWRARSWKKLWNDVRRSRWNASVRNYTSTRILLTGWKKCGHFIRYWFDKNSMISIWICLTKKIIFGHFSSLIIILHFGHFLEIRKKNMCNEFFKKEDIGGKLQMMILFE